MTWLSNITHIVFNLIFAKSQLYNIFLTHSKAQPPSLQPNLHFLPGVSPMEGETHVQHPVLWEDVSLRVMSGAQHLPLSSFPRVIFVYLEVYFVSLSVWRKNQLGNHKPNRKWQGGIMIITKWRFFGAILCNLIFYQWISDSGGLGITTIQI